jgi:hypothetical protein
VTFAVYPTCFALSGCCVAASGRMLMRSLCDGFPSQAWLSAATFTLWSALATLLFWGTA